MSQQNRKHKMTTVYDKNDRVIKEVEYKRKAGSDKYRKTKTTKY